MPAMNGAPRAMPAAAPAVNASPKEMLMPTTIAQIAIVIERNANEIIEKLGQLTDEQLNRPLPVPDANSLFAIATHTVGMGEFWVLSLVGGRTVARNRPAEFQATGQGAALIARFQQWLQDIHAVLDPLPDAALHQQVQPPREYSITGGLDEGPLTVFDCLLHVVEHTATHLGHIQLTADFLQSGALDIDPASK